METNAGSSTMSPTILRSDARLGTDVTISNNINSISVHTISEIEKELEPYDTVSLVFLLYDTPDTALQRLIVYQRVYKDIESNNTSLIYDWAVHAQSQPNWKYKFLEALAICQLYGVIRKLGFQVPIVKQCYSPDKNNFSVHINPLKKTLYKVCENTESDVFFKLKKTLTTFGINTTDYEFCELLLLELMSQKFLNINHNNTKTDKGSGIETFAKIIEQFHSLKKLAKELREIEADVGSEKELPKIKTDDDILSGNLSSMITIDDSNFKSENNTKSFDSFDDIFNIINEIDEGDLKNLKSDTKKKDVDAYAIHNSQRIGTCLIINQEKFHPSKYSIENDKQSEELEDRVGSSKDKKILEETMSAVNFKVITRDNLSAKEMLVTIKNVIKYEVDPLDSVFMLCILSHGIRGHVYGVDSVEVNIDDIQNLLDSKDAKLLHKIPKVIIIQACQVNSDQPISHKLVADSPSPNFHVRKSLFLIFWATAPEFEAYRYGKQGSFFIHILCKIIKENYETEHFADMCITVNRSIRKISEKLKINQMSEYKTSLTKKLYLKFPS